MLVSYKIVIGAMVAGIVIPFIATWRKGGYKRIIVVTWLSVLCSSIFIDFAVPRIANLLGEAKAYHPPSVPISILIAFTGWLYGFMMAGLIWLIRRLARKS
jgi:hypothetical protein